MEIKMENLFLYVCVYKIIYISLFTVQNVLALY